MLVRTLGPGTKVGGPSTSSFQPEFFEAFLSSCLREKCPVDFLCWHELEPWSDIALVEKNIQRVRRDFVESPRFRALNLREIHVNEYIGEVDQYRPAELLAFLFYLERGGADYASRSCWGRHCEDNSIDGIIDAHTRQPRAPWWVHALYAAGCERRVRTGSDFEHVVAIGQGFRLSGLSRIVKGRRARIKAMRIPDGFCAVNILPVVHDQALDVVDDQVSFSLDSLALHEAYAIRVEEV